MANNAYKQLIRCSCLMLNLVRHRADYGTSFCVLGKTYEEATADALRELEQALVASGVEVHVPIELEYYLRRQLDATHLN